MHEEWKRKNITRDMMRWTFGIRKSDRYYYTPNGLEDLEVMWSEHCVNLRREEKARERLAAFIASHEDDPSSLT